MSSPLAAFLGTVVLLLLLRLLLIFILRLLFLLGSNAVDGGWIVVYGGGSSVFGLALLVVVKVLVNHILERVLENDQLMARIELRKWIVLLHFETLHDLVSFLILF